jgi:hypothetical protein
MAASTAGDIRLRIPGFRRYAIELERLRGEVAELEALRSRLVEAEEAVRALQKPGHDVGIDDAEWLARAKKYEYYWVNAAERRSTC